MADSDAHLDVHPLPPRFDRFVFVAQLRHLQGLWVFVLVVVMIVVGVGGPECVGVGVGVITAVVIVVVVLDVSGVVVWFRDIVG